jgi:hypothetical protein
MIKPGDLCLTKNMIGCYHLNDAQGSIPLLDKGEIVLVISTNFENMKWLVKTLSKIGISVMNKYTLKLC